MHRLQMRFRTLFLTLFTSTILVLFYLQPAVAWDSHHLVTRAALAPLTQLHGKKLRVTSFQSLVKDFGLRDELAFNTMIEIHKSYRFTFHAGETVGRDIELIEVLSIYSDEPDWKMDQELFEVDQYPELWRDEYAMMGGTRGVPSQAFRHMYWPKMYWLHPLQSIKFPPDMVLKPMGEAHRRAQMFYELAKHAKARGHDYWAARFTACSIHYLEDVTNPFHSSQIPTKKFLFMPLFNEYGSGLTDFIKQLTNIVSYYHFSFEKFIGRGMRAEGNMYAQALADVSAKAPVSRYKEDKLYNFVKNMASYSNSSSAVAGRAALGFFPPITVNYVDLNTSEFMNDAWWEDTLARGEQPSKALDNYKEVVDEMFRSLGWAVR